MGQAPGRAMGRAMGRCLSRGPPGAVPWPGSLRGRQCPPGGVDFRDQRSRRRPAATRECAPEPWCSGLHHEDGGPLSRAGRPAAPGLNGMRKTTRQAAGATVQPARAAVLTFGTLMDLRWMFAQYGYGSLLSILMLPLWPAALLVDGVRCGLLNREPLALPLITISRTLKRDPPPPCSSPPPGKSQRAGRGTDRDEGESGRRPRGRTALHGTGLAGRHPGPPGLPLHAPRPRGRGPGGSPPTRTKANPTPPTPSPPTDHPRTTAHPAPTLVRYAVPGTSPCHQEEGWGHARHPHPHLSPGTGTTPS